jgi:predicted nucleic acid-binding protein
VTWFLDASVLLAAVDATDAQQSAARALLSTRAALGTLDLAFYEVTNVALRAWDDPSAARTLRAIVAAIDDVGGIVRIDESLAASAAEIATAHALSAYDAAYVAGAASFGAPLVSCDVRDLVGRGLASTPTQAVAGE